VAKKEEEVSIEELSEYGSTKRRKANTGCSGATHQPLESVSAY
jgi:hypothetical protein